MRKITKIVYEGTKPGSILQSIVNPSVLNEWPWSKKQPEPAPEPEPENNASIELKALDMFSSKLIQTKSGTDRLVLRVTASSIRSLYFDPKGPENFTANMSDEQVLKFTAAPTRITSKKGTTEIQLMPKTFKFSDQLKTVGAANYAILLNVPDELVKKLNTAKSAGEAGLNDARTVITEMLSHKFYVMVLDIPASKKIAPEIDAAEGDLSKIADALVPGMLVAMPKAGEVKTVRDAIIEHKDTGADEDDEEADPASSPPAADPATPPAADPAAEVTSAELKKNFKKLLADLASSGDAATVNQLTQLLADIGQAPDKKKKMSSIANMLDAG